MTRPPTITELEDGKSQDGDTRDSIDYGQSDMSRYQTRREWIEYAKKCKCPTCLYYLASRY